METIDSESTTKMAFESALSLYRGETNAPHPLPQRHEIENEPFCQ